MSRLILTVHHHASSARMHRRASSVLSYSAAATLPACNSRSARPGRNNRYVLARRLAEDTSCSVLVIERGDARDIWLDRSAQLPVNASVYALPASSRAAQPISGSFLIHHTIDSLGNRQSTFRAFLPKEFVLAHSQDLHICVNTVARKIETEGLVDGNLRATGVVVQSATPGATSVLVKARRGVVLCSGVLRTPQVGVGPEKYLRGMGIPVVHNLEGVGSSLRDHMGTHIDLQYPLKHSLVVLVWGPCFSFTDSCAASSLAMGGSSLRSSKYAPSPASADLT
ncbi:uncharacterized protein PHACADRAFT_214768 [Phanerochaete carnosa HHB-10118-sp]|uniref:Glucose-methanol-choline oxidoreductase N-terminal domain-containing protein n=1 Tax=Phanerochaete carnosa (strain HHB-10118-sp) TaxID=650164 RepID=K5VBM9_PHACS|nr:uncharacterized protein PHACADRAFT_214768 [Phanerochaete carnosa HHB-10118-sp]EKM48513.1 hypothetical protein PHACADRAFT_214768 [Phanerochaete carnosa HHB-10118-sp]